MYCPACNHTRNPPGADACENCGLPLTHTDEPALHGRVERSLMTPVSILSPSALVTVAATATLADAIQLMIDRRVGCMMVVDGDRLLGIFSERDAMLRLNVDAAKLASRPVSEVMTVNPATLRARDKIAFALHRMNVGGFRHLPILDNDDKLIGVISIRDILRYLTDRRPARR